MLELWLISTVAINFLKNLSSKMTIWEVELYSLTHSKDFTVLQKR